MADHYFVNTVRFPHETIDGETVVIDARNGYLYLLAGTGTVLWERFAGGGTIDAVVAEVTSRYGQQAEAPTRDFLRDLVEAKLLISLAPAAPTAVPAPEAGWPETFTEPVMERYDEISDIITMDPIHQVDPAKGWPREPGNRV